MKKYLVFLTVILFAVSCDKDDMDCDDAPFDGDGDGVLCNVDCDDAAAGVSKSQLYYVDNDGDTFGDKNDEGTSFCEGSDPVGYSTNKLDCDDSNIDINPNAEQGCDGIDNNCDGQSVAPQIITYSDPDTFCSFDNVNCTAPVNIPFMVSATCIEADINIELLVDLNSNGNNDQTIDKSQLTGSFPNYSLTGNYPFGELTLTIKTENCGCGITEVTIPFTVEDCKAPSPICINGLSVELQAQAAGTDSDGDGDIDAGAINIFAIDFIAGSITDCSLPIIYSINLVGDSININQNELVLTCDDDPTTLVEVHAWDGVLQQDYCETYILITKGTVQCN